MTGDRCPVSPSVRGTQRRLVAFINGSLFGRRHSENKSSKTCIVVDYRTSFCATKRVPCIDCCCNSNIADRVISSP